MGRAALLLASALVGAGCTLVEVALPEVEQIVVVEGVLRPDSRVQRIVLHASVGGEGTAPVRDARVTVRAADGREIRFDPVGDVSLCLEAPAETPVACYVSPWAEGRWVRPGEEYELEILLPGGGRAGGRTRVPGAFRLLNPAVTPVSPTCSLPPATPLPLVWSRSAGTWSYLAELEIDGLRNALAGRVPGDIPDEIRLTALSISEADTTMLFPADFGVFQRTEFEQPLLLALRDGLPPGIVARVTLAAVDRNYVNAVRGGSFNPSGRVRIPSVSGDATGLFGSVVREGLVVDTRPTSPAPPCLPR